MHRTRLALVLVAALFATGCEQCDDTTVEYEAVPGEAFYDYIVETVDGLREDGWDCPSRPIRNAFGVAIGTRYTCTKCI